MGYYIGGSGYYEGDRQGFDEEVPQRPSADYIWADGEWVFVAPVPQSVTRRKALQALILDGKYDLVQPAIDAIEDETQRQLMQIEWDDSQDFERNRPALIQMATAIGLTASDLDALFIQADKL